MLNGVLITDTNAAFAVTVPVKCSTSYAVHSKRTEQRPSLSITHYGL